MEPTLRALSEPDLEPLRLLQQALAAGAPRWSAAELRAQLYDVARDHGRNAVVAARGGEVLGVAGWVHAHPWLYGAPVVAAGHEAAERLVGHLVATARALGVAHVRVSAGPAEVDKRAALERQGFEGGFDFITLARPLAAGDGAPAEVPGLARLPHGDLDPARLAGIQNDTFRDVPNSPPTDAEEVSASLLGALVDRDLTAAWADSEGRYRAFLFALRDVEEATRFVTIDAIGVHEGLRGRRVGQAILMDAMRRNGCRDAPAEELRALIASTNRASLALHERVGLRERCRRTVYQLDLDGPDSGA